MKNTTINPHALAAAAVQCIMMKVSFPHKEKIMNNIFNFAMEKKYADKYKTNCEHNGFEGFTKQIKDLRFT